MWRRGSDRTREGLDAARWEAIETATDFAEDRQFEQALVALRQVVLEDAQNSYAYNLMGTIFWEMKQLEAARDAFRAAVLSAPNFLGARVSLSHTLRRLRDPEQAEREARLAITRLGDDGDAHHALGLALLAQGKRAHGERSLRIFLDSKPEFEAAQEVRGLLAMMEKGEEGEPLETEDED